MDEINSVTLAGARVISSYTGDNQQNAEAIANEVFEVMLGQLMRLISIRTGSSKREAAIELLGAWERDAGPTISDVSGAWNPH